MCFLKSYGPNLRIGVPANISLNHFHLNQLKNLMKVASNI